MLKTILSVLAFFAITFAGTAQKLSSFTVKLQPKVGDNSYLSIGQKKVFNTAEAKANKASIDLALVITEGGNHQVLEWYNLNGKDDKIPNDLRGTAVGIAGLSFDNEQFEKCNTAEDPKRMTGHITNNSFSHFGSITDEITQGVKYHCFLIQLENGKRVLLWIEAAEGGGFSVTAKA